MMIAQLTDTHVLSLRSAQPLARGRAEDLRRCVADINRLNPLPDAVIHTGDLTHEGDPEAYALARDILSELVPPFYPIPGNCDNRAALADTFGNAVLMPLHGAFVQYAVCDFPLRLIGLDTQGTIGHDGDYDDERIGELGALLDTEPEKPTVLFMHHAPFAMGADPPAFRVRATADRLAREIARHSQVIRVFCGHHHASSSGAVGTALGTTAPATAIDRREGPFPDAMTDKPVYEVHVFDREHGFIPHTRIVAA
ncbi:MAG: metallophosphoesterase [Gammaproteobacteria bacterium]|nr:metallophosphoesterase [Gammaproteobacteria bacterium]